jgi:hypothetical protein
LVNRLRKCSLRSPEPDRAGKNFPVQINSRSGFALVGDGSNGGRILSNWNNESAEIEAARVASRRHVVKLQRERPSPQWPK